MFLISLAMNRNFIFTIITAILSLLSSPKAEAQNDGTGIIANPKAIVYSSNNEMKNPPDTIYEGDKISGGAPLEIKFISNVESDKTNLVYEWVFSYDSQGNSVIMQRRDEDTDFPIQDSGTYYVQLLITDVSTNAEYASMPFSVVISESLFELPNAFSPNGDGINDVYKIKQLQSIVKFNAYIFNRWGQELFRWDISNINEGWDGTFHGKKVKDGVYFIRAIAEGADGIKYEKKMAINVLTGTSGNMNNGQTTTE